VFTARYALSPYIKQIHFVFKGLNNSCLTAWRGVLDDSRVRQPVKKFPTFHATRWCITVFLAASSHLSLTWARWIQSTSSHTVSLRYILNIILPWTLTSLKQHIRPGFVYNTEKGSCDIYKGTHSWVQFYACTHTLKKFRGQNAFISHFSYWYFITISAILVYSYNDIRRRIHTIKIPYEIRG
jgi:hypothetical protein